MFESRSRKQAVVSTVILFVVFSIQWFLFKGFVVREMAWSPFLNGDANWYLGHSYIVFDSIIKNGTIPDGFFSDPAGIMVLLVSSVLYMIFGASRLAALSTNFIPYLMLQGFLFYMVRYVTKSWLFAFAILGLCLTAAAPFQVDTRNTNHILNIMEYQREFGIFCFFGIFIALVLFSDTFAKRKWSIWAGLSAGFMVSFRYNTLFHMLGIYFAVLATILLILFVRRRNVEVSAIYKSRFINGILSCFSMGTVCAYPFYRARYALYNHYFVGRLIGPKDVDVIKMFQHGANNFWQWISYYPRFIVRSGLGSLFISASLIIGALLLVSIILSMIRRRQQAIRGFDVTRHHLPYSPFVFYWFLLICIAFPLSLLTAYPIHSGNISILVTTPCIIIVFVFFAHLFSGFIISENNKVLSILKISMLVVALSLGIRYQMNCYSLVSFSSHNREDYLEVARMYDGIIAASKANDIKNPGISVNFSENYVLGCGEAITAYQYEHAGEMFRVRAILGSDIGRGFEQDEAIELIRESDLMLLDTSDEAEGTHETVKRGMLSHNLAQYPFAKSMLAMRPVIREFVEDNFLLKDTYKIFNRQVELYINKNIELRPIAIRASSQLNEHHSADTILETSSNIWHSESTPTYPQWLEFEYEIPLVINSISILCQVGAPQRGPSDFCFQGQLENGQWRELLKVSNAGFATGEELKSWPVENIQAFKCYRLYITKNNGAHDLLTIEHISFGYADSKDI